jgi:hypothetical protein
MHVVIQGGVLEKPAFLFYCEGYDALRWVNGPNARWLQALQPGVWKVAYFTGIEL